MRNNIIAISLCCMIFCTITQVMAQKKIVAKKTTQGFVITGTAKNVTDTKIYLKYEENGTEITDSTIIKNEKFNFKGKVEEPVISTLQTSANGIGMGMFLENASIIVTIDTTEKINTATGSKENAIYKEWEKKWYAVTQKAGPIYKRINEAHKGLDKNVQLDPQIQKGFDEEFANLSDEADSALFPLVRMYPNSAASAYIIILRYVNWNNPVNAEKTYAILSKTIKQSSYGRQISAFIELDAKTGIGRMAIDFTMNDISGKPLTLSSLRGQYVLLDFWASWCGPCRKENPNVVKAYAKYHDLGLEILGVSLDNKKEFWEKAVANDKLSWIHVSDLKGWKNSAAALYGVTLVPTNFLLDKSGKIIARNLRGEDLEKKLAELFKQN